MAFTVETGEGLSNANSNTSLEFADSFHADGGTVSVWLQRSEQMREQALVRATTLIDIEYIFRSVKMTDTQALQNPRFGEDGVNVSLQRATALLALYALDTDLFPVRDAQTVLERSERADGIASLSEKFSEVAADRFPLVTAMLKDIATRRKPTSARSGSSSRMTK